MTKASEFPFSSVNKRSAHPFELVHMDLWGPSPVLSKPGFRYYVCIVDDYARFTWLILLKSKFDFYQQFLLLEKFVEW